MSLTIQGGPKQKKVWVWNSQMDEKLCPMICNLQWIIIESSDLRFVVVPIVSCS